MVLRLRGGGYTPHQLGIAAGGSIQQTIRNDTCAPDTWHKEALIVFNVQILNADVFEFVTGRQPPTSPITAQTYAALGLPFFTLEDKPSGISGTFDNVKSVAELDGDKEMSETFPTQYLDKQGHTIHPDSATVADKPNVYRGGAGGDLVNPLGPFSEFRCASELRAELEKLAVEE